MKKDIRFPCESTDAINGPSASDVERIYMHMADDYSKRIFSYRLLYSLTGDYSWINKIILESEEGRAFDGFLNERGKHGKIYIYGAGIRGHRLYHTFPNKNWGGAIDEFVSRDEFDELPIYRVKEMQHFRDVTIIISNLKETENIKQMLILCGIKEQNIFALKDFSDKAGQYIYFDDAIIKHKPDLLSYYIDGGCYDAEDCHRYSNWIESGEAKILGFEPDKENYLSCKESVQNHNIKIINAGLANQKGEKKFIAMSSENSKFSENGDSVVHTVCLDEEAADINVGFIKLDIEGMEESALEGAANIILNKAPILAISIYHKREDIWRLPKLILKLNPDYRFFLRHYTVEVTGSVLYAIRENYDN